MIRLRWVIVGVGSGVTVALLTAALLVNEHWIEVASWVASCASLVATVVTAVVPPRQPAPPDSGPVYAAGTGAVVLRGYNSGEISTDVSHVVPTTAAPAPRGVTGVRASGPGSVALDGVNTAPIRTRVNGNGAVP
jgi:hypothetical protein